MNWSEGYLGRYYITIVDPVSWRDIETHDLLGGSVTKTENSLMESADIDLTDPLDGGEAWIRIWLDARQEGSGERSAIFTGLLQIPETEWEGTTNSRKAECYSVLKPADDVLLPRGWYAPAGMNGAQIAAELLSVGPAPVVYDENAPSLTSSIVAEDDDSNLSMAQKIIETIGQRIRISGDGRIRITAPAAEPSAAVDSIDNDIVEAKITYTRDWYSCPNVLRITSGDLTVVVRDEDPDSPLSTAARGREIWAEERDCKLNDGEGITEYGIRRLKELQAPAKKIKYVRRYLPDIVVGDMIRVHYPAQGIEGNYLIKKQSIELGYSGRLSEEGEQYD